MEWRTIKGFEGYYEVSEDGQVRSLPRKTTYVDGRVGYHKGRIIALQTNHKGYFHTSLSKECNRTRTLVHRLVAEAFIPNPNNKEQVNHIDANKKNNHYSNLEWVTNDENQKHMNENGLRHEMHTPKAVAQYDLNGNFIADFDSMYSAAQAIGSRQWEVNRVVNRQRNSHKGFTWKLIEKGE